MNDQPVAPRYPPRYVPGSDAEFQKDLVRPGYADARQIPGLDGRMSKTYTLTNNDGTPVLDSKGVPVEINESLLNIFEMFTQDVRLGNLDNDELSWCRIHFDLAQDLMHSGNKRPAMIVWERGVSVIETSHSKKGWLRELLGSIITKNDTTYREPKKSLWTGKDGN